VGDAGEGTRARSAPQELAVVLAPSRFSLNMEMVFTRLRCLICTDRA